MPEARSCHTAAVVDGKIYVVGGEIDDDEDEEGVATDRVDMYDPAADSWQQMAAMPTARSSHSAAVLDGKIYVTGGSLSTGELSDALEAYDPVANTWTTLASFSQGRHDHTSAVAHGRLCVFGGELVDVYSTNSVEVYSPASNSWARAADVPVAISFSVAVAL